MDNNSFIKNRQNLLFMVEELHKLGFGKLRVIPSLSPSGMHWRCSFISEKTNNDFIASNWIYKHENKNSEELCHLFIKENPDFIKQCIGENEEYVLWYRNMVENLEEDELPYAFADHFHPTNFWTTSNGRKIKTLPNEKNYYF